MPSSSRLFSPAAERNRAPILQTLLRHLPASGLVLEIASGSGQHIAYFAANLPALTFQPSDLQPENRASINGWAEGLANVRPAIALDASASAWPLHAADAILCANMIHIAPWEAAIGLVAGAGRLLASGGLLALYGPYRRTGVALEPSNAAFDIDLRRRSPVWGVREVDDVTGLAVEAGFTAPIIETMPANNLMLLFRRLG